LQMGLGFATGSTAQGATTQCERDNRPTNDDKFSQQRTDSVILLQTTSCRQDAIASFTSMNADGFTVNKSDPPTAPTPIFYLAIKGGQYKVGSFNQATVTGNQSTTGVGFQPAGLMMLSFNKIAQPGLVAPSTLSIGAANSSASRGNTWMDAIAVDPSDSNVYSSTNTAITMATGPTTINAQADFVSFGSDSFTLNWTTADATKRQILYWAMGPNVARSCANIKPVNLDWREVFP